MKHQNLFVAALVAIAMTGCGEPTPSSRTEAKGGTDTTGPDSASPSDVALQTDEQGVRQDDRQDGRRVNGGLENRAQLQSLRTPMPTKPWGSDDPYEIHGLHHIFWATAKLTGGTVVNYSDFNGDLPPDIVGNSVRRVAISIRWDYSNVIPENPIAFEPHVAAAIENYARQGIKVTAVLSGVPAWARRVGCLQSLLAIYLMMRIHRNACLDECKAGGSKLPVSHRVLLLKVKQLLYRLTTET